MAFTVGYGVRTEVASGHYDDGRPIVKVKMVSLIDHNGQYQMRLDRYNLDEARKLACALIEAADELETKPPERGNLITDTVFKDIEDDSSLEFIGSSFTEGGLFVEMVNEQCVILDRAEKHRLIRYLAGLEE